MKEQRTLTVAEAITLAMQLQRRGDDPGAARLYREVLRAQPANADALHLLGVLCYKSGDREQALELIRSALVSKPDYAVAHNNLGLVLVDCGQPEAALASFQEACAQRPGFADALCNSADVLRQLGQLETAEVKYREALAVAGNEPRIHSNLGATLQQLGRATEAAEAARQAIALSAEFADAHNNLGNALRDQGLIEEAVLAYRKAIELRPDYAQAYNNLGVVLELLRDARGGVDEAADCYRRALALDPAYAEAYSNLGNTHRARGRMEQARDCYQRAIELRPKLAQAHNNLGGLLQEQGQLTLAGDCYRRAFLLDPGYHEAHSNYLFCAIHDASLSAGELYQSHREYGRSVEQDRPVEGASCDNDTHPERQLRVGVVSGDLRDHAVAYFIEPLFQGMDPVQFQLYAYSNHYLEDDVSQRLKSCSFAWRRVYGLADKALADLVKADGIDILIDFSGHTRYNRLPAFALKPAPVQVSWIGYPATTGLRTMDYRLVDQSVPVGMLESQFSEKLVFLPTGSSFKPHADSPPVNPLPALEVGCVTFASFNRASKLTPATLDLWARVLVQVPGSRLLLGGIGGDSTRRELTEQLVNRGLSAERLLFRPKAAMIDYLAYHHEVDIILDTFPYTGGTISRHALWMGVPVLTLTGTTMVSIQTARLLWRLGLQDWVCDSADDFVEQGVRRASQLQQLAGLRAELRERIQSLPASADDTVVRGLQQALRQMWRRWCAGLAAESFVVEQ